jgi:hypothetical protein
MGDVVAQGTSLSLQTVTPQGEVTTIQAGAATTIQAASQNYVLANPMVAPAIPTIPYGVIANHTDSRYVLFTNRECKEIGRLSYGGDELVFEGAADACAKIFFEHVVQRGTLNSNRIREECAKLCESKGHKALANLIRERIKT